MVRIASFHVENLLERPRALSSNDQAQTQKILAA